jgi:hypothetical protein
MTNITIQNDYLAFRKTVCANCRELVSEEQVIVVIDQEMTHTNPQESHLECPHCHKECELEFETKEEFYLAVA